MSGDVVTARRGDLIVVETHSWTTYTNAPAPGGRVYVFRAV